MQVGVPVNESAKLYQVNYLNICGEFNVSYNKFSEIHLVLIFY